MRTKAIPMRIMLAILLLTAAASAPSAAAETRACLDKKAQAAAVSAGKAIPLGKVRAAQKQRGEVVRAQLCQEPRGLVYMLTLLPRNGKVMRVMIDAATGNQIGGG